jgi:hypothetical protein
LAVISGSSSDRPDATASTDRRRTSALTPFSRNPDAPAMIELKRLSSSP